MHWRYRCAKMKNMKKKDYIIIIGIILIILLIWGMQGYQHSKRAQSVRITVDGSIYGTYSLQKDQEIKINDTNILQIKDAKADIIWADCKNQICVEHKEIAKNRETITCLPNKVVVEIIGGDDDEIDTIAK